MTGKHDPARGDGGSANKHGLGQPADPERAMVLARRTLLDALEALRPHLDAIILVGAQAIYLHTGDAELSVAPLTSDADLVLDPHKLGGAPAVAEALTAAGFVPRGDPGAWASARDGVELDLMVPKLLAGPGRRGARLPSPHGKGAARSSRGLEAALVDHAPMAITALDPADTRTVMVAVAGPAALLVAKLHKLAERQMDQGRLEAKDALDVFRLLKTMPTAQLRAVMEQLLTDSVAAAVTKRAITLLDEMFGTEEAPGVVLAVEAAGVTEDPVELSLACVTLARRLLTALGA